MPKLTVQIPDACGDVPYNEALERSEELLETEMTKRFGNEPPTTRLVGVSFEAARPLPKSPEGFEVSTLHEWRFEYTYESAKTGSAVQPQRS